MTGDDFIKLAGELYARSASPGEAACRTIVGRAYYGAYHLTLAFLADLGLPLTSDHKMPVRWLIGSGNQVAKKVGRLLEDLYESRRRADYKLDDLRVTREFQELRFVKTHIEMAADVKSLLATAAIEPARSEILAGIESFRRTNSRGS
jgi:hypothetical protein